MNLHTNTDDAGIVWVTLDDNDSPGTLTAETITLLEESLAGWETTPPAGVVLQSARADSFLIGRSADELADLLDQARAREIVERGQRLLQRIAGLPCPVVAKIRGYCRDAGLELALACRYRVADSSPATSFGFTELHLGLHPCFGSFARLPDLIGTVPALDLMTSGRVVDTPEALRLGLVDRVASDEGLDATIRSLIQENPGRYQPGIGTRFRSLPAIRWLARTFQWSPDTQRYAAGRFPASGALRKLERQYRYARTGERIRAEAESILQLLAADPTRNLIRSYLLKDRLVRESIANTGEMPKHVHVIGAGAIGSEVAVLLVLQGLTVSLHDHDSDACARTVRLLRMRRGRQAANSAGEDSAIQRLHIDEDGSGAETADFIIEAIGEDLDSKRKLYESLATRIRPNAVVASTSSTLGPATLAEGLPQADRMIGLHFFHPVSAVTLVEIITGSNTGDETIARTRALVNGLGRIPLQVHNAHGSVIWRLAMAFLIAGATMYRRERRELIDTAARYYGMPMGPLEMADSVGLDTVLRHAERLGDAAGFTVPEPLRASVEAGHLGAKTGAGFHDWRGGRQVTANLPPGEHDFDGMAAQMIEPVLDQAARCRDEGLIQDPDLLDAGAILGFGFPAWTGGPLHHLERRAGKSRIR